MYCEVLPAAKSTEHAATAWTPGALPGCGVPTIASRRASVTYAVSTFPTDWPGTAFRFEKVTAGTDPEAESYSVFCGRDGRNHRCECKGFLRWRTACKHILAGHALIANRWLGTDAGRAGP